MRSTKYYMNHLQKHFDEHWSEYGDTAGWLVNPAPNKWQFIILEESLKVTLTCNDNGYVSETVERVFAN